MYKYLKKDIYHLVHNHEDNLGHNHGEHDLITKLKIKHKDK